MSRKKRLERPYRSACSDNDASNLMQPIYGNISPCANGFAAVQHAIEVPVGIAWRDRCAPQQLQVGDAMSGSNAFSRAVGLPVRIARGAKRWSAKNSFLVAALTLSVLCAFVLSRMRESESPVRLESSVLVIGVDHGTNTDADGSASFSLHEGEDGQWRTTVAASTQKGRRPTFAISDVSTNSNCKALLDQLDGAPQELFVSRLPKSEDLSRQVAGGTIKKVVSHFQVEIPDSVTANDDNKISFTMSCPISLAPMHDGSVDRSLQIWGWTGNYAVFTDPQTVVEQSFELDLSDLTDRGAIAVSGGYLSNLGASEMKRAVTSREKVITIRWRSEASAFWRDALLLAIGALLGVAGACLVEWLRPKLEEMASHAMDETSQVAGALSFETSNEAKRPER